MRSRRRLQLYLLIALMLAGGLAELLMVVAVVPFLSALTGEDSGAAVARLGPVFGALAPAPGEQQLYYSAALLIAAALAAAGLRSWLAWTNQSFTLRFGHELTLEIQRRTLLQPYQHHLSRNSSETIAAVEKVEILVGAVLVPIIQAVTSTVVATFIIAALLQVDPFATLLAGAAVGAAYLIVSVLTRRRLARNSRIVGEAYAQRIRLVQESLGGIRDVIIDNSQRFYLRALRELDLRFIRARAATAFIATAPRFAIEAVGIVTLTLLALIVGAREGGIAAALPILGALALGAQRLLPLVQQLYGAWALVSGNRAIVADVLDQLHLPVPPASADGDPVPLPFDREIRFRKVSFTYSARAIAAVCDVELAIPRGSRVAIVGRTGSGKSTLADILMGLLEPTQGEVLVDNVPLTDRTRARWRKNIAHVPQAIFLADTSIASNIAFGTRSDEIDMKRVREAAQIAEIDAFVETLPEGYETQVGERGVRLSGGQRQRLGIARAIYKRAPLLVLDEATNALDEQTEGAVLRALDELSAQGRTIVIIGHRRSAVRDCDFTVRMQGGRAALDVPEARCAKDA